MELQWKYVKPLSSSDNIAKTEQAYRYSLPNDIIEVIEKYNGGRPSKSVFDTQESKERVFKTLLSYNKDDIETVFTALEVICKENSDLVPIASDPGGNYICHNKKSGDIVLWLHEVNKIENISSSFTEFLAHLYA